MASGGARVLAVRTKGPLCRPATPILVALNKIKYKLPLTHCNANAKFRPSNAAPAKYRPPSLPLPAATDNGRPRCVSLSLSLHCDRFDRHCNHCRAILQLWRRSFPVACNSVLYCVTDNLIQRLQSVFRMLITRTGRHEHITPVLRELHWLPVQRRIEFKLATLLYKTLQRRICHAGVS